MTYIRKKMINGSGPYFYEVRSVRDGKQVRQEFVKYWGTEDPRLDGRFQASNINKDRMPGRTLCPKDRPRHIEVKTISEFSQATSILFDWSIEEYAYYFNHQTFGGI